MADGKQSKVRRKKSEQHRRIRRRESWAREEKEIKELEHRCRDVSCRYPSLHRGKFINELIFGLDLKHCHVLQTLEKIISRIQMRDSQPDFPVLVRCTKTRNNNTKPPKRVNQRKRNDKNETTETSENAETTKTNRPKRNYANEQIH